MSIKSRHYEAHSGFYLTLVSIMQGLALGYLLQVVAAEITSRGNVSLLTCFQSLASLSLIIIVWHEYAMGTVMFRWQLDMLDSTIPFLFGIVQYIMIAAISIPVTGHAVSNHRFDFWLWSLPAFCLVSCLAYWNQHSKAIVEENFIKPVPRRNLMQASVTAGGFMVIAFAHGVIRFGPSAQWIVALSTLIVFVGHAVRINCAYDEKTNAFSSSDTQVIQNTNNTD